MDVQKRLFLQQKVGQMDRHYWRNVAKNLGGINRQFDELQKSQYNAVSSYFLGCVEIAETKYHGYMALLDNEQSEANEQAIANEYKTKLKVLEQHRIAQIQEIRDLLDQLLQMTQQPFPLAEYNEHSIVEEEKAY